MKKCHLLVIFFKRISKRLYIFLFWSLITPCRNFLHLFWQYCQIYFFFEARFPREKLNQKLKLRMKSHFGETIVFHQPYQKNSPEIVYSSFISVQDVINRSAIRNNTESSTPQADYLNQPSQDPSAKLMLYRTAKATMS